MRWSKDTWKDLAADSDTIKLIPRRSESHKPPEGSSRARTQRILMPCSDRTPNPSRSLHSLDRELCDWSQCCMQLPFLGDLGRVWT